MSPAIDINTIIPGCKNFSWSEALFLPKWGIHCFPNPSQAQSICDVAAQMETIRAFFGNQPINVTSWIRPPAYNVLIGGAPQSAHMDGQAVDFQITGMNCDDMRAKLLPMLATWNICMENKPGADWVHIDTKPPRPSTGRYFIP
jgi:uncharacterized protein YcbK (DUF882 family)